MSKIIQKLTATLLLLTILSYAEEYRVFGVSFGMDKSKLESNPKFTCEEGLIGLFCKTTPSKLELKEELPDIDNISAYFYNSKLVLLILEGGFMVNRFKSATESYNNAKEILEILDCKNKKDIYCSYIVNPNGSFFHAKNWIGVDIRVEIYDERLEPEYTRAGNEAIRKERELELNKKKNKIKG